MTSAESHSPPLLPGHACMLFCAQDIHVCAGVNLGDALGEAEAVCPGDIYELIEGAVARRLVVARQGRVGVQSVAPGSDIGAAGDAVRLAARYTLMGEDGDTVDLLLLRLQGAAGGLFALPLSPIGARIGYTLLKVDDAPAAVPLSDLLCVSFARGTMITLANGSQRPIEALAPGDRVLTRDHGAQPLRWLGHATLRGVGAFAPVVISKGTMGNAGDLIVSQHHRMFLYQRRRGPGVPTAELLVQARHLVDGAAIFLRIGGFVDYFSLVFDQHEIIYAEGIPAESLMVNEATLSRLPADLAADVKAQFPGLSQNQHFGTEAGRQLLDAIAPPPRPKG
ncbi:MAG: Hint domain-containing protein [Pseudorhodobacter sp.]|nr:Hint domain-containing protein [Pseudorhodobacter sp.]